MEQLFLIAPHHRCKYCFKLRSWILTWHQKWMTAWKQCWGESCISAAMELTEMAEIRHNVDKPQAFFSYDILSSISKYHASLIFNPHKAPLMYLSAHPKYSPLLQLWALMYRYSTLPLITSNCSIPLLILAFHWWTMAYGCLLYTNLVVTHDLKDFCFQDGKENLGFKGQQAPWISCNSCMVGSILLLCSNSWETPCSKIKRSPVYFRTADYCQTWREATISIVENMALRASILSALALCFSFLYRKVSFFWGTGLN